MSELYKGTKFKALQIENSAPQHTDLKKLIFWCSYFNNSNLAPPYPGGSSGNLSYRISEQKFIITAGHTALCDDMEPSDFVIVNNCNIDDFSLQYSGKKLPSSESIMHYSIYKNRPEINAVFHGHSADILENAQHFNFKTTQIEQEYGTIELIDEMMKILEKNNFIILKNHGFIALGKTIDDAGKLIFTILEKIKNLKH